MAAFLHNLAPGELPCGPSFRCCTRPTPRVWRRGRSTTPFPAPAARRWSCSTRAPSCSGWCRSSRRHGQLPPGPCPEQHHHPGHLPPAHPPLAGPRAARGTDEQELGRPGPRAARSATRLSQGGVRPAAHPPAAGHLPRSGPAGLLSPGRPEPGPRCQRRGPAPAGPAPAVGLAVGARLFHGPHPGGWRCRPRAARRSPLAGRARFRVWAGGLSRELPPQAPAARRRAGPHRGAGAGCPAGLRRGDRGGLARAVPAGRGAGP